MRFWGFRFVATKLAEDQAKAKTPEREMELIRTTGYTDNTDRQPQRAQRPQRKETTDNTDNTDHLGISRLIGLGVLFLLGFCNTPLANKTVLAGKRLAQKMDPRLCQLATIDFRVVVTR
jgi:hypothetical protein